MFCPEARVVVGLAACCLVSDDGAGLALPDRASPDMSREAGLIDMTFAFAGADALKGHVEHVDGIVWFASAWSGGANLSALSGRQDDEHWQ